MAERYMGRSIVWSVVICFEFMFSLRDIAMFVDLGINCCIIFLFDIIFSHCADAFRAGAILYSVIIRFKFGFRLRLRAEFLIDNCRIWTCPSN